MKLQRQIAKNRVVLALSVALLMAANGWGESIKYIDENGVEQTADCTVLTSSNCTGNHTGGWYVVKNSFTCPNQIKFNAGTTDWNGTSYLILADGATLTINVSQKDAVIADNLYIYGQKKQTGTLKTDVSERNNNDGRDLYISNLYVYGGNIHATTSGTDAICATSNITINGGSVHAVTTGGNNYYGIKAHCTINYFANHDIFLDWRNATDLIYANSYSGNIAITSGKSFKDEYGNIYSSSLTNNSAIAGKTLTPEYLVQFINIGSSKKRALINGEYTGSASLNISQETTVDSIDYNRTFTAGVPATVVLPFSLPEGATTNAKFYRLTDVVKKNGACAWEATAQNIATDPAENAIKRPQANEPYIVLLNEGNKLEFDLSSSSVTFNQSNNPTTTVSDGKWSFIGVYSFKEWKENDEELGLAYAFAGSNEGSIAQGKFGKIAIAKDAATTGYPYANPFRAYLKKRDSDVRLQCPQAVLGQNSAQYSLGHNSETIDVQFIDEDENGEKTTFMARMNTRTGEFTMLPNYDAKGRKIAAPKVRGAYYGKKNFKK